MALAPGTRLGPYAITAQIGAGGMGEVWYATDTDLGRQVAIKVLPDIFAHDPERLARFEREAKTLAALNHRNIAGVYGLEKTDGIRALVMELVEGPTLADRIAQGPIAVNEALPIAKQIAEALEAAHEQGIIHRDLKPANIKLRHDGTIKVLDFGLAKTLEPAAPLLAGLSQSPTITTPAMTQAGMILGTAAYMSPEQANGSHVDSRSDIWAFGCVLYEMITGRRAFTGDTVPEVLASVLKTQPDWSELEAFPGRLARLLRRCLERDPARRLRAIADVRIILEDVVSIPTPSASVAGRASSSASDCCGRLFRESSISTAVARRPSFCRRDWFERQQLCPQYLGLRCRRDEPAIQVDLRRERRCSNMDSRRHTDRFTSVPLLRSGGSSPSNLFWVPADGSVVEPTSLVTSRRIQVPSGWSPDSQWLLFEEASGYAAQDSKTAADLMLLAANERSPRVWLQSQFSEGEASFSPDGQWVAFVSDPSGKPEIWVRPFPGPGSPVRVSAEGGRQPVWARNGKELFYLDQQKLMATEIVTLGGEFRAKRPRTLFEGSFQVTAFRSYDVAPDGRFLMIEASKTAPEGSFVLVQNWVEELKQRVQTD